MERLGSVLVAVVAVAFTVVLVGVAAMLTVLVAHEIANLIAGEYP